MVNTEMPIEQSISIYPNPASSSVTVITPKSHGDIKIYSLIGDLRVLKQSFHSRFTIIIM